MQILSSFKTDLKTMIETHFTIEDCSNYFERKLSQQETLALFTHIESCKHCAKTYDYVLAQYRNPSSLRFNFSLSERDSDGHLDREELLAYSKGVIEKVEFELIEHHAMNCLRCKNALENIVAQRGELKSRIKEGSRLKPWFTDLWEKIALSLSPIRQRNFAYAASLLCLTVIGGLVIASFWKKSTPRIINDVTANSRTNIQNEAKSNPPANINSKVKISTNGNKNVASVVDAEQGKGTVKDEKTLLSTANPKPNKQLVIKDRGDEEILIRSNKIVGAKNVSPVLRDEIVAALNGKDIAPPPFYTSDDSATIKTRGSKPEGVTNSISLLSPVNKTIRTDTPTFEWESGSISNGELTAEYQVSVVDEEFNLIAQSPVLKETEWKIETPLVRGKKYRWQVKVFTNADDELQSSAPDKGASFKILSESEDIEIAESEKRLKSHLALGVMYLKAGLLDEAEREICALQKLNPKSEQIKRLLDKICKRQNSKVTKLRCKLSQSN